MIETIVKICSSAEYLAFLHRVSSRRFMILALYFSLSITSFANSTTPFDYPYIHYSVPDLWSENSCDGSHNVTGEDISSITTSENSKLIIADEACNLANNSEFDNGTAYWYISNSAPAAATLTVDNTSQLSGVNSAFINVTNSTGTIWHTQFNSGPFSIDASKKYNLVFEAKSTGPKDISFALQQNTSPYTAYYNGPTINVTTTAQTFSFPNFSVSNTATDALLKFYLNSDLNDIWIDNVRLEEVDCDPSTAIGFDDELCYFISDGIQSSVSIEDTFYTFNYITGQVTPIGPTGTYNIESMAMDTVNSIIYTVDGDDFGLINATSGQFIGMSTDVGNALNGAEGVLNINDIDGMTFDHALNIIWATERRTSSTSDGLPDDLLLQIDPNTGLAIKNAFGAGIDYVIVDTPENDLDDIAIDKNGTLYAISNLGGSGNQAFGTINKTNGTWTNLGDYGIEDVESLSFTASGQLVATTGKDGSNSNELFTIDAGTGLATFIGSVSPGIDVEACDCISANLANLQIGDRVFVDSDKDGIQDALEPGVANVVINLLNGNGSPYLNESGQPTITTTNNEGIYNFDGLVAGNYIVEFDIPVGATFTVANVGSNDELDSDANITTGRSGIITLAGSSNNLSVDAGTIPEICDNDLDDDGDGFIDEYDPDCSCITAGIANIDFNKDTYGQDIIAGASAAEIWSSWGVHISTKNVPSSNIPLILDSSNPPSNDLDLGTPNEDFSGPGVGAGGESGKIGENNTDLGNVLIVSTNGEVNDYTAGGTIVFDFDVDVDIASLEIVDFDYGNTDGSVTAYDMNNNIIKEQTIYACGDNCYQKVAISATGVRRLEVLSNNSFSVASLNFCDEDLPNSSIGDFVWFDENQDGSFIGEAGIENVVVKLLTSDNKVLAETTTDATGAYSFDGLPAGEYIVQINAPSDMLSSYDLDGDKDNHSGVFTLASNQYRKDLDFGLFEHLSEICDNGIDDDGDNLIDEEDPDCSDFCEAECPNPYEFNWYNGTEGAQWPITNGESVVERLYEIDGDRGLYVVTVTMNNPNGQNIDLSNCGTAGNHFYTATCNDPNATFDCDGDPLVDDGQFNYDCGYLTFGITSNNSDEYVSITYDFPYPTQLCDFEIGDIDYQPGANAGSWQDEIDIVADSLGTGVNIHAKVGNAVIVNNNATPNINILANVNIGNGNISPNDEDGHAYITTLSKVTSITFSYSNGPDDEGVSDDHAIRLAGFSFCPDPKEICDNGIDDDGDGLIDCQDPHCTQSIAEVSPDQTICEGAVAVLTASGGGSYQWDNGLGSGASHSVSPATTTTYTVTVTSPGGCTEEASTTVVVSPEIDVVIDFNGSQCLVNDSKLSAIVTGGIPNYQYSWTGPNGFTASTQTIDITEDGNYYVVVTDSEGCTNAVSAFVYESYEPFIFALNTTVCEGESVTLSISGASATGYQWSANADDATTQSVTVIPTVPSSSYSVTVTNSIGCTAEATATIDVDPKPIVSVTGSTDLCIGETSQLSPTTGGVWSSSNSSVATVNNSGVVTAMANGSVTFTFESDATNCVSDPTANINVGGNTAVTISGDDKICFSDNPTLTASVTGGAWSSANTSIATVDANGVITPQGSGSTTILYTVTGSGCYDDGSYSITIYNDPTVSLNGPSTICEGDDTFVNASTSGTWSSSDESIATISSSGVITGVSGGSATISFLSNTGCTATLGTPITVIDNPVVTRLGPAEICIDNTTTLSPTSGGIWISSNNNIASVSTTGIVTGKAVGTASFTFIESSNGCVSDETISIQVYGPPSINGLGDSDLCIGETTIITPSSGGTWTSTNNTVATIDDNGVITAMSSGTARFTFTSNITGCESDLSAPLTVNDKPSINFTGPTVICKGEESTISPTSGGQWSSTDVTVATISQNGKIIAVNPGTVSFIFTSDLTGCSSDLSTPLTVNNPTEITVSGPSSICIDGTTNLLPSSGGTWSSSNTSIASITNSGTITGHNAGVVTFIFDSNTGCTSDPSADITVIANPITTFTGPSEICIGSTTNLSPNSGGVWTSSDTNVATVANDGLVTAVGFGTAQFTFVDNASGCETTNDVALSVYNKPVPQIVGDDNICVGFSTFLTPSTGGTWTSSNTSVAIISSDGQVTGVSPGTATFTFYETGSNCVSDASDPITVLQKAPVSITGDNTICIDETTTVSPTTGGTWISNNPSVATVTNAGIVTGVSQGIAKFTFISDSGCESNETSPVIVYGPTAVSISGPSQVCIGDNVQLLPSSGGVWTSNNTSVATIDNNGLATTLASGVVNFTFVDDNTGCESEPSEDLIVGAAPTTGVNGPTDICIGSTTFMLPSSGGIWTSLDPTIATIQNNGQVTGVSPGTARFIFTSLSTGCVSEENNDVTILSGPDISFTGPTSICEGETTSISSTNEGTWISADPTIATITDAGIITGVSAGSVRFRFTETSTGCISDLSDLLTVNGPPTVSVSGSSIVCIGSTTTLNPNTGGTWISLNPEIATTTSNGIVTGVDEGTAYFVFTDAVTGCKSDGALSIDVAQDIETQITGDSEICTGYTTTLLPNTGGTWMSSNPAIATVSNFGVVTGKAPGIVTFTFTDSGTGCSVGGTTEPITVENCINHDFNVSLVNQTIVGNLNTNDNIINTATYSNIEVVVEKPVGSLAKLTVNPDGSYSFVTNKPGKYIYKVSVCIPPSISGCPSAFLEINVLDNVYGHSNPVSNLEYYTTYANTDNSLPGNAVTINPMENDDCVYTAGCSLDNTTMTIVDNPGNGSVVMTGNGTYTYTPNAGFIGQDTIHYQVCESAGNCSESSQIITVNAPNALNSVVASDDFAYTLKGIMKTGNVMNNDSDPEGDNISVVQQGSMMSPIVISEGEYYINNDGSYGFTPNSEFSGPLEIIYTVCDDNTEIACTKATLHIQVFDDLSLRLRVYLEGSLMENSNQTSIIDGRPLMRDGLRVSPFTGENYIPLMDPYTYGNELYDNTPDMFVKMGPGLLPENMEITDSLGVFSVTGPDAIVDWVHVEIRDKNNSALTIATRSALLQRDGDIVDLDGVSSLRFQGLSVDSFYVCVRHRTHLGVMSELVSNEELVDFTSPETPTFNFGKSLANGIDYVGLSQKSTVKSGYLALWAGDFNSDGQLKFTEPASDINILYGNVLFTSPGFLINYDFTFGYFRGDYNMDGKAKYANPNDDRNYLQAQIIFHPLNTNYISNLDGAIQQVP